jgi:SAM-dependent methyltransferase
VDEILADQGHGALLLDYSGGTGILTRRLLARPEADGMGVLIVDSSPKFLRLALERSRQDPRVGYRLIRFLKDERRLQRLDEVVDKALWDRGLDAISSTNAIHLYYGLDDTVAGWFNILKPGGVAYIQSGNIRNSDADEDTWIIDETVEHIHRAAMDIVATNPEFEDYKNCLSDAEYMESHDKLRAKYFLPVRDVSHYRDAFERAGFNIRSCVARTFEARVTDWYAFLSVYHEGVLGWIGGAQKITGEAASEDHVVQRQRLMRMAMDKIFNGEATFNAAWTYFQCVK